MNYNYRYRLRPSDTLEEQLAWTVDTVSRLAFDGFLIVRRAASVDCRHL
jgi:putative transposase